MCSIISRVRIFIAVSTAIALVGVFTPASAIAVSSTSKPASTIHQVLEASQQHPQLAIPGETVDVTLVTGKTEVRVLGPRIPQVSADALPGTFFLTFTQKSGRTLISIKDFGILDGAATLIRPVQFDGGTKSFYLKTGQKRIMKLTSFMAIGTGTLRWAPLNHYVTDWQFVEETV